MNAPMAAETVADLRETVCMLHGELVRWGLVTWTSGNVSGRAPSADRMVTKPSGIAYDADTRVDGGHRPARSAGGGSLLPSSDTLSHAYIYRAMPEVNGIVHTHARTPGMAARHEQFRASSRRWPTSSAARSRLAIRPDLVRGSPCRGVHLAGHRSRWFCWAVPCLRHRHHGKGRRQGGRDVRGRRANVHHARMLGEPVVIDPADVDSLYERYQSAYGQK